MNIATVFLLFVVAAVSSQSPVKAPIEISEILAHPRRRMHSDWYSQTDVGPVFREDSWVEPGVRFRRATCDLLSFDTKFGSFGHSACAAHCLAMGRGFKGGRCKDGVCHCRR